MGYSIEAKREYARQLRKQPTQAEDLLWMQLSKSRTGYRFYRQFILRGFIVDFYCPAAKLAIEVDGSVHILGEKAEKDAIKENAFRLHGIGLLRFTNEEVVEMLSMVLDNIRRELIYRSQLALKAVAFGLGSRDRTRSSSNRCLSIAAKNGKREQIDAHKSAKSVDNAPEKAVEIQQDQRITAEEWRELCRKLEALNRRNQREFSDQPAAQKAWEQKYRLAKHLERKISEAMSKETE